MRCSGFLWSAHEGGEGGIELPTRWGPPKTSQLRRVEPDMNNEPWASVDDVAKHIGVAKDSIYRWIDTRGLPAHKIGRLWKFKLTEVDEWVRAGGAEGDLDPKDEGAGQR